MADSYKTEQIIAADKKYVWHHLTNHKIYENADPTIFTRGRGMYVTDIHGKEYLDAVSGGVWTVNLGYDCKPIIKAVADQLSELCYFANGFGNIPTIRFSKKLIEKMPGMSRVYLSNSGSEANEKAFKIVRQISAKKYGGKKSKILFRNRDYHGTTITTLSACGQEERRDQYGPYTPGFVEFPAANIYRSPYPQGTANLGQKFAEEMEKVILKEGPETIGGVIIEPITAGGGVLVPPDGYAQAMNDICKKYDILLIIDEVVCGLGRTGEWFGYQHFGFEPDIVTMAKGVAAGYAAISCTVTTEQVFQDFIVELDDREGYFRDISTFGGCTAGPAAGLANLKYMEEHDVLANVVKMGAYLLNGLKELEQKYELIGDVRGKGLFCGLELVKDRATKEPVSENLAGKVVSECMKQGVIVGKTSRCFREFNNTICLAPALICTEKELNEILRALDHALANITAQAY